MDFGHKLREFRLREDLSLAELAKLVNTATSTLSKYENNEMLPKVDALISICSVLNCTPDQLLGFKNDKVLSPIANECASIVESMTWTQKQWVFLTLNGIKNGLDDFEKSSLLRSDFLGQHKPLKLKVAE